MKLNTIKSQSDLIKLINEIGFLPFFQNEVEGFSLEDCIARKYWFSGDTDGAWEWKGPVIHKADCAYGKFFCGKAGFISREWFYDFANFRRDGYDFDALYEDGLAKRTDKLFYDILEEKGALLSKQLKTEGNFKKGGNKGFDSGITRLQMQGYVVTADFEYLKDKTGKEYGWGVARYELPERQFDDFSKKVYQREPEESFARIMEFIRRIHPAKDVDKIEKLLRKGAVK